METSTINTINIKLIHPTNNSDIDIGCPANILMSDVFTQLIEANFLSDGQAYSGVQKPSGKLISSVLLDNNKSLHSNGVEENATIQILLATMAGGGIETHTAGSSESRAAAKTSFRMDSKDTTSEIKILGIANIPDVSFDDMLEQKQSIVMLLHSYKKLEEDYREVTSDYRKLKQKSNDRKSAVIVNTTAGVVIAIGAAFLTDAVIPSVVTIGAGVLMVAVGMWLTFKDSDN